MCVLLTREHVGAGMQSDCQTIKDNYLLNPVYRTVFVSYSPFLSC